MPYVILVGAPDEIRQGRGEVALTSVQTAARLGISQSRLRELVRDEQIQPTTEPFPHGLLYRESDVERLKAERDRRWIPNPK